MTDYRDRLEALRFLGRMEVSSLIPTIRSYLSEGLEEQFEEAQRENWELTMEARPASSRDDRVSTTSRMALPVPPGPYPIPQRFVRGKELRIAALLALTRLGNPDVHAEWLGLYGDEDIHKRISAAVALFYLEEGTADGIINLFAAHTERADIAMYRYIRRQSPQEFQGAILYLRSPRLDALFLERIRHGFDSGDHDLASHPDFALEHAGELLPLLVSHLESNRALAQRDARRSLETLLGPVAGVQDVSAWHEAVETYLAEWKARK